MRALALHSPRGWKTSLFVAPACLVFGLLWWVSPGARFRALTAGILAAGGVAIALWALWREHNRNVERRGAEEAHSQFLAAAEANLDAFSLFESVRDKAGKIVDFRFLYVNANAERMIGLSRSEVLGKTLCNVMMVHREGSLFSRYCKVVDT